MLTAVAGDYAELLEESGLKAQAGAPMAPVVKLVFGIDHGKAGLTEYAAALSYAERQEGGFGGFIEQAGSHQPVAIVGDRELVERAIRRVAG